MFRELVFKGFGHPEAEGRVLLSRHYKHGVNGAIKNQLAPGEAELAQKRGEALASMLSGDGVQVAGAFSSPQPRCIASLIHTMIGMGELLPIHTIQELSDITAEPVVDMELLKLKQERLGIASGEEAMLRLDIAETMQRNVFKRSKDGSRALLGCSRYYPGKTVLVFSHSGSRIEPSILGLKNRVAKNRVDLGMPNRMFKTGEMVELIVNLTTGRLVEENYLDF